MRNVTLRRKIIFGLVDGLASRVHVVVAGTVRSVFDFTASEVGIDINNPFSGV